MSALKNRFDVDEDSGTDPETRMVPVAYWQHKSSFPFQTAENLVLACPLEGALSRSVLSLQREVVELTNEVKRLCTLRKSTVVPVTTLAPEPYQLMRDIPVVVQPDGEDGFIASFFDANLSMSGETETDAVTNLKAWMVDVYEDLEQEPEDALGPEPARQLAVLRQFIRRQS